ILFASHASLKSLHHLCGSSTSPLNAGISTILCSPPLVGLFIKFINALTSTRFCSGMLCTPPPPGAPIPNSGGSPPDPDPDPDPDPIPPPTPPLLFGGGSGG